MGSEQQNHGLDLSGEAEEEVAQTKQPQHASSSKTLETLLRGNESKEGSDGFVPCQNSSIPSQMVMPHPTTETKTEPHKVSNEPREDTLRTIQKANARSEQAGSPDRNRRNEQHENVNDLDEHSAFEGQVKLPTQKINCSMRNTVDDEDSSPMEL